MANVKITQLPELAETPASGDLFEVVDISTGLNKKVQAQYIGVSGVESVTGDIVDNTDPLNPIIGHSTLQEVTDEDNVVEYGAETTFVKFQTSADVFAQIASDDDGFVNFETQTGEVDKTVFKDGGISVFRGLAEYAIDFPGNNGVFSLEEKAKTANFTAENSVTFIANGTLTVTDPTPVTNKGYIVHVIGGSVTIGGVAYTSGALVYRYHDGSSWISTNMNSSTLQDLQSVLTEGGTATDLSITLDTVISDTAIILDPSGENISITDTVTNETLSLYKERLLKSKGGFSTELAFTDPTANRVVTIQDEDGTLAFLSDIPAPITIDATPTDGSSNAVSSNGVFDALALKADKNRVEQILHSKNNGTYGSHTGNTSETVIQNINIGAGDFAIGDWMNLMFDFTKVGTAGTANFRLRAGTLGTTGDAVIATALLTATTLDYGIARERFQFKTGNILRGINNTFTASAFDIASSTSAKTDTSLNPSNAWILTLTVQLGNSGDTASCEGYTISKISSF